MRKTGVLVSAVLALACASGALEVRFGGYYGARTFNDGGIRALCDTREVYQPFFKLELPNGLGAGIDYEGFGASGMMPCGERTSRIGLSGWEAFLSYEFRLKALHPYFRGGYGYFRFDQEIGDCIRDGHTRSPLCLPGFSISAKKGAPHLAAGIRYAPTPFLGILFDAKYVPLKMRPATGLVNLGGWRFSAGLEIAFGL